MPFATANVSQARAAKAPACRGLRRTWGASAEGAEGFDFGGGARDHDLVALTNDGLGRGVLEGLAGGLHGDDGDAELLADAVPLEAAVVQRPGCRCLGECVALIELDVVQDLLTSHEVGDALAHVVLGAYDVVDSELLEDLGVG